MHRIWNDWCERRNAVLKTCTRVQSIPWWKRHPMSKYILFRSHCKACVHPARKSVSTQPVRRCRSNALQTTLKNSTELGPGPPRRTFRRKNTLEKQLLSETGFFANPLCDFFYVSRAIFFEISGDPDFCSCCSASSTREQKKSQNKRSQDIASKCQRI